jgi:hypothetical protein
LGVGKAIKMYPAIGWVRANTVANEHVLSQINILRDQNEQLKVEIEKYKKFTIEEIGDLASVDEDFVLNFDYEDYIRGTTQCTACLSWRLWFSIISPYLLEFPSEMRLENIVHEYCLAELNKDISIRGRVKNQDLKTLMIQLNALGLIEIIPPSEEINKITYCLTEHGKRMMLEWRTIKTKS